MGLTMTHAGAARGAAGAVGGGRGYEAGATSRPFHPALCRRGFSAPLRCVARPRVFPVVQASAAPGRGSTLLAAQALEGAEVVAKDENFCGSDGSTLARPAPEGGAEGKKKFFIHTFGCQMNLADSERMAGALEDKGYACVETADDADVLIYNTCTIRERAEEKVYSALGRQVKRKHKDPELRIVVAGCMAAQEGEALLRRVPELDLVMGPHHANLIGDLLDRVDLGSQVVAVEPIEIEEDISVPKRDSQVTAWVNAIYGCNESCTYCVVPSVRGGEQSRDPDAIKREMLACGEAGYKEVTLLGQNIDAYGRDLPGAAEDGSGRRAWTFTDLLYHVHDAPGIERIRFATSHPRYFTERLIRACADLPKMMEYFHIPFQSGDNDILREMQRGYTHERYRRIVDNIRRHMPDAAITADVIVGFPGETEEQFENTVRMIREVGFDLVNTAAYSARPNTPAALWENQVADLIKADRLQRINAVVTEVAGERSQRYQDRVEEVLVEKRNPKKEEQVMGRTRTNRLVYFPGGDELVGQLVHVRIDEARTWSLSGVMVDKP
mmetsp:Transcript_6015/g.20538  ORF Transcript_6015/g.20538 Transcript_6015/m.20538 type:complete len:554 (-) Transcript_6015:11-1672(-)